MTKKKRAILLGPLLGGGRSEKELQSRVKVRPSDLLVGVDGGTWFWKRWGYTPDFAIGDWDSLGSKRKILNGIPHQTLSPTKDRSDLYHAVQYALDSGVNEILCLGVTGGRPDHQMAMILDLSTAAAKAGSRKSKLKKLQCWGSDADYIFLSGKISRWKSSTKSPGESLGAGNSGVILGATVSLFALHGKATGVSLSGFEYCLRDEILQPSSHGLSNRVVGKTCEVSLRKGQLLVIIPRDGEQKL